MRNSIFCLSPAGDTPSSARLFDAIVSGCIPVVVSDELELPFKDTRLSKDILVCIFKRCYGAWMVCKFSQEHRFEPNQRDADESCQVLEAFHLFKSGSTTGAEDFAWRMKVVMGSQIFTLTAGAAEATAQQMEKQMEPLDILVFVSCNNRYSAK
ncbi:hypothetical protein HPP92_013171 [Vanilla planifolia]|uniref:Exostosin GT47 domain-containing protein n=1 Tax=Vanilla planifolia TaxID=51239 RepID=A0A835QMX2_VANPL|nr:hypothetical protein HPP92_013171 [Vanilla planifolia]